VCVEICPVEEDHLVVILMQNRREWLTGLGIRSALGICIMPTVGDVAIEPFIYNQAFYTLPLLRKAAFD
jgi:hypothetical protein